ncbi:MAG TPA: O-methyltransferase [Vicinamibacterales bacterium]|nr:O-methyltransferase [Vicinamibacterales bacterium]
MADDTAKARWTAVDDYVDELLVGQDAALREALGASTAAGLPSINVTPAHGKMLHLLARAVGARMVLEIGTLGGYSTIWLARALAPGGRLVTIEADAKHAAIAGANIARADVADRVDLRIGRALDVLPGLAGEGAGPFDMIFIDADKPSTPDYFSWALRLSRPGTMILIDNVVRDGAVADADSRDPSVVAMRRVLQMVASEPRVSATVVQTVGGKGYDGLAIVLVTR